MPRWHRRGGVRRMAASALHRGRRRLLRMHTACVPWMRRVLRFAVSVCRNVRNRMPWRIPRGRLLECVWTTVHCHHHHHHRYHHHHFYCHQYHLYGYHHHHHQCYCARWCYSIANCACYHHIGGGYLRACDRRSQGRGLQHGTRTMRSQFSTSGDKRQYR